MRRSVTQVIRWGLLVIITCVMLVVTPILWNAYHLPTIDQASETLADMYQDDQYARRAGFARAQDIARLLIGDWQRRTKVKRMIDRHMLTQAADYYHAAVMLQHGTEPSDYLLAKELAEQAIALGDDRSRKVRALAEDRYLVSIGQLQRYGSQFTCMPPTGWSLYPVDPSITDSERRAAQMPTLEEQQLRIAHIQQLTEGECALNSAIMQEIEAIMGQ